MGTSKQLAGIAAAVKLPVEAFAEAYDPLVRKYSPKEKRYKVLRLFNLAKPELAALKVANKHGFVQELAERLVDAGAFGDEEAPPAEFKTYLQAVVSPNDGIWDVGLINKHYFKAVRRVCRIVIQLDEKDITSTGFLVGPQTVITSWHAIRCLLDKATNKPRAGSSARIKFEFGRIRLAGHGMVCGAADDWLVAGSPPHSTEDPEHTAAVPQSLGEGFEDALDYAVLALDEPVGQRLGYFQLDPTRLPEVEDMKNSRIFLLQHPSGAEMRLAAGHGTKLWPSSALSRLSHTANSMEGSSGGLVVDFGLQPVALHQSAVKSGTETINCAIPTASIIRHGKDFGGLYGNAVAWRLVDGTPLIGRQEFQRSVIAANTGDFRILSVGGGRRTGRSFSERILRDMVPPSDNRILSLKAADIPAGAVDLARLLISRSNGSVEGLPDASESETGKDGWIRDYLFPPLVEELRQAAGDGKLWIVIDELDLNPLSNTAVRHLLELIYAQMAALPFLRVVLLGLDGPVPAANPKLVKSEVLLPFTEGEIRAYLETHCAANEIGFGPEEMERHAKHISVLAELSGDHAVAKIVEHISVLTGRVLA